MAGVFCRLVVIEAYIPFIECPFDIYVCAGQYWIFTYHARLLHSFEILLIGLFCPRSYLLDRLLYIYYENGAGRLLMDLCERCNEGVSINISLAPKPYATGG